MAYMGGAVVRTQSHTGTLPSSSLRLLPCKSVQFQQTPGDGGSTPELQLPASIWVLGTERRLSARAAGALDL